MQYKKFFSAAALVTLLSLSNYVSADPMGSEDEDTSYYVRGQYNVEYFNIMSGKEVKFRVTDSGNFTPLHGFEKGTTSVAKQGYKPHYNTSFITGSAAAGYMMEGVRVEIEALYSQLDVDVAGYSKSNSAISADDVKTFGKASASDVVTKTAASSSTNAIGKNEGFTTMAAMVNAYYDVDLNNESIPVTPYVGVGVGIAKTTFVGADHWMPAYQAKAGVSYAVTPEIKVYGGYRYFGLYGNEFKEAKLNWINSGGGNTTVTTEEKVTLQQEGMYGVHGVEAGVMFNF